MIVASIRTSVFEQNGDLYRFVLRYIPRLSEKTILVVTSKIVALAEGRVVTARNKREKERVIRAESEWSMRTALVWLTMKDGMLMASAGIDESNARGALVLLPRDSTASARLLRDRLRKKFKIKKLGVLITDSRTAPLRRGITGVALGYAGFRGLRDYRGTKDIFGRRFKFSCSNVADCLASAAVVVMGEGNERQPLALITNAPVVFKDKNVEDELRIPLKDDMYAPLFRKLPTS